MDVPGSTDAHHQASHAALCFQQDVLPTAACLLFVAVPTYEQAEVTMLSRCAWTDMGRKALPWWRSKTFLYHLTVNHHLQALNILCLCSEGPSVDSFY